MIERHLRPRLLAALSDTPVVLLNGARQVGKSTLVRDLLESDHAARYFTFDDAAVLSAAAADPAGFLAGVDGPIVIDEVQRLPEIFLAIKAAVDRERRPGRFLLTGSADVLLLPRLADSLAGRMEIATLWPLSQNEIEGVRDGFIDTLFTENLPTASGSALSIDELMRRIVTGGYPEAVARGDGERRDVWFASYIGTILQRDIRDIANIDGLTELPRLLALLAARSGSNMNIAEISRSIGIPHSTLKRYMALLEMTFLTRPLPAWSGNLGKRLVKTPKLLLCDTGLACHLIGADTKRLLAEPTLLGSLLETFVAMELIKGSTWSKKRVRVHHYRSHGGEEVDLVLEDPAGRVVGIEVKATRTVTSSHVRGLRSLAEQLGERFVRGIVLYTGDDVVPFGETLHAVPMQNVWRPGSS